MDGIKLHPVRAVVRAQGRTLTWVALRLGISVNYLHRILTDPADSDHRPAPEWFYSRLAVLLGVPESMIRPAWEQPMTRPEAIA